MDDITVDPEGEGLFSKRSSSNILSDPRILEHLRIVAEEAQSLEKNEEQDAVAELVVNKRELAEKIAGYNKRNQLGAFRLISKEDLNFEGALRFYFEDGNEKLTKAVRLTNHTLVSELLPTLIEKFKPDLDQSSLVRKAKLYEVHDEFDREADEICLDPSDYPLDIALNAKRPPRFVLRLDIERIPDKPTSSQSLPNHDGTSRQPEHRKSSLNSSAASIRSAGSDGSSTSGSSHMGKDSPRGSKFSPIKGAMSTPPVNRTIQSERPTGSGSDRGRIFFKNATSPRAALGMFFDGVGPNQQDQSVHHTQKAMRGKRQRKRSFGSLLKLKKNGSPKKTVELSTDILAPGILKVFGGHVSPGANYKSVRATELTPAADIVKEALERYSLKSHDYTEYVLCDVIGYFTSTDNNKRVSVEHDPSDSEQWITEYARVIGDKEKPLVLQQLWKPITGFSRRFELRKRLETQDSTFFKPRGSVAVVKAASVREVRIPSAVKEVWIPERTGGSFSHFESFGTEEGSSSSRPSVIVAPFVPFTDTPYLLLLRGYDIANDFLYHRLDEQMALIGAHVSIVNDTHDDHHPDVSLFAPDVLAQHCVLSKKVETTNVLDMDDCDVNFVVYLEPYKNAYICVNGVGVNTPIKLIPGDLISLGSHYIFMFKDPTQVLDRSLQFQWMTALQNFHEISKHMHRSVSETDTISSEPEAVCVAKVRDDSCQREEDSRNKLKLSYKVEDEDSLLDMMMGVVELHDTVYELTPAYLMIMIIEHSAKFHTEIQTRQLLLKICNSIQSVAQERTSDMSNTIEKDTAPRKAFSELLPQLTPVIFWMANVFEVFHFLQPNISQYVGRAAEVASLNDEALANADVELLFCLEEVVMYSFQQTVFHLTKVLYVALPIILDTNPFQYDDDDDKDEKRPQEIDMVVNIFNATYDIVHKFNVNEEIIHQLFAYLFFFTNASLFNTLMERGAGGKFYRWAKGAQIRGNLDALEGWASQAGLQEEYAHYLKRLSTAADLLATPKVQLLQADWMTIRRDFPALNDAQVQQILGEYQLGAGKTRPRGWFPPPEEVEPALRTADILLSFGDHPPLSLPTSGFVLDMQNGPKNETFYNYLAAVREATSLGFKNAEWSSFKSFNRAQRPEPEVGQTEELPVHSAPGFLGDIDDIDVPSVIVSPATPRPISDEENERRKFFDATDDEGKVVLPKQPITTPQRTVVSPRQEVRPEHPVPAPRSPELRRKRDSPVLEKTNSGRPLKYPQPTPRGHKKEDPLEKVRKPRPQMRPSAGGSQVEMTPRERISNGSTPTGSPRDSPTGSRGRSGSAGSSTSSFSSSGMRDENQNVRDNRVRAESESYVDDGTKWVEINGSGMVESLNGLSVLPVEERGIPIMETNLENEIDLDDARVLEKAKFMRQLQRNESQRSRLSDDVDGGTGLEYKLEGMRDGDDAQDDVFIVELERTEESIGLGLIDGLYTPLRSPGIYVKTLVPGGAAMKDGRLRLGDRILAVNGTSLVGADYQSAMQQIRQAGEHLSFLVAKSDIHVAMKITASSC